MRYLIFATILLFASCVTIQTLPDQEVVVRKQTPKEQDAHSINSSIDPGFWIDLDTVPPRTQLSDPFAFDEEPIDDSVLRPMALKVRPGIDWERITDKDTLAKYGMAALSQDTTGGLNRETIISLEAMIGVMQDSAAGTNTVSGTPDYITLLDQDIVRDSIDLSTDVKGVLPQVRISEMAQLTTDQRDSILSPVHGKLIYNTTKDVVEVYQDSTWVDYEAGPLATYTYGNVTTILDDTIAWDINNATIYSAASTFTGWGTFIGVFDDFDSAKVYVYPFDGALIPTQYRLIFRDTVDGTILADDTTTVSGLVEDELQPVSFSFPQVTGNTANLWVEILSNGRNANVSQKQGTESEYPVSAKYSTTASIADGNLTGTLGGASRYHTNIILYDTETNREAISATWSDSAAVQMDKAIRNNIQLELSIADTLFLARGYTRQLFYRSIIELPDPYVYNIEIKGNYVGDKFPRYFEGDTAIGTFTTIWNIKDDHNILTKTDTAHVEVGAIGTDPTSNKKVLMVGNSLTSNGVWVTEFNRMVTGTGGVPLGLEYDSIELIGTQGSGANLHEGNSGVTYNWYLTNASSPFVFSSVFDPAQYISSNGFTTVDYIYILMGWNNQSSFKGDLEDWASVQADLQTFLDGWIADFPNIKIGLIGLQPPSPHGGLGDDYGYEGSQANLANYFLLLQTVNSYSAMVETVSNSLAYRNIVDYIDMGTFFDAEYNYGSSSVAVNTRNAATEEVQTDGIHPSNEGYYQISDAVFNHFVTRFLD